MHDKGEYAAAIAQYATITPGDSIYPRALVELALSYQANKQSEEAIAAAGRATAYGVYSPHLYTTLASAQETLQHFDLARAAYAEGLRRYPYAATLWFNKAIFEFQQKEMAAALVSIQRSLELQPLHASSHLLMGYLEVQQNHPAHAMLGLLTFLALEPSTSRSHTALLVVEQLATNADETWRNDRIAPISPNTPFEELDLLISSKVALRKEYKTKVKFDANIVRQAQLLAEKFPTTLPVNDFWGRAYGPLIKVLQQEEYLTAFTYLTLSSATNTKGADWTAANKGKIEKMSRAVTPALLQLRDQQAIAGTMPEVRAKAWFGNDDLLDGLGEGQNQPPNAVLQRGEWLIISDDGAVLSKGTFSATGERTGRWLFYHPNGELAKEATYVDGKLDGPLRQFFDNGVPSVIATYRNGLAEGEARLNSRCGGLREIRPYQNDKITGDSRNYYLNGQLSKQTTYRDGERAGEEKGFYDDGSLEYTQTYVADQLQGPFEVYYADKTLERKGAYDKDELHGPYTTYHDNGQLDETGTFEHGKRIGLWKQYYRWGKLSNEKTYGAEGELNGTYKDCDDEGRTFAELQYVQGRVTQATYYNTLTGKLLDQQPIKKSGLTTTKPYFYNGSPLGTGTYRNGKMEGEWRTLYFSGALHQVRHFTEGQLQGITEEYYANGQVQTRQHYTAGQPDGPYQRFHVNGQVAQAGYYRAGQQQGIWQTYYIDGKLQAESEYVDGELNGLVRTVAPGGKTMSEQRIRKGWLLNVTNFDSTGGVLDQLALKPTTTQYELHYPNGRVRQRITVICGDANGLTTWLLPDGQVETTAETKLDRRHGAYLSHYPSGQVEQKGTYRNGQMEGEWLTYEPGGELREKGRYLHGERHGTWVAYALSGKVVREDEYKDGLRDAPTRYSNYAGELLMEKQFVRGELIGYRGAGADGKPTGALTLVPPAGSVVQTTFPNGKPAAQETYRNGLLEGERVFYYSSGHVYRRCRFVADEFEGPLVTYYPSGKLLEEENYRCGELEGVCRYYRPDGTLERTATYRCGVQTGPTTTYDAQGKPTRVDIYWGGNLYDSK